MTPLRQLKQESESPKAQKGNTMKTYMLEWTENNGATYNTMLVSAEDYSKAYLQGLFALPRVAMITDLFEIV